MLALLTDGGRTTAFCLAVCLLAWPLGTLAMLLWIRTPRRRR